ncbi:MAG: YbaK/EbsC family protein [Actinomycetota bacterium]|nr:YbaK/EbsC family protein [Actinomycetota bacterium]
MSQPKPVTRVIDAASQLGLEITVSEFPDGTRTAEDAAKAVGCLVDQIVKSMVFDADGALVLALTSGAHQVDPARLAELVGASRCGRVDVDMVRTYTGYAIGGVPPLGHDNPLPTWIDPHLLTFEVIWAAAGTPRHVFPVAPNLLRQVTGASIGDFAR